MPNPFAALVDPASVLSVCSQSRALAALPVSAKLDADRMGIRVPNEAAESDAEAEAVYLKAVEKAAKQPAKPTVKPAAPKTKKLAAAQAA